MGKKIESSKLKKAKEMYYNGSYLIEICRETGISYSCVKAYIRAGEWVRGIDSSDLDKRDGPTGWQRRLLKDCPYVKEISMLDACRRLMWILENDLIF